jgi:hypothetical protein
MEIWEAVFGGWRIVEKLKNNRSLYLEVPIDNDRDSSRKEELKQLKDDKKDATTLGQKQIMVVFFFFFFHKPQ